MNKICEIVAATIISATETDIPQQEMTRKVKRWWRQTELLQHEVNYV